MCQLVIDIHLTSCSVSSLHTRQSRQHIAELPTKFLQNKHRLRLCQISANKHLLQNYPFLSLAKCPQLFQYLLRQHATILYILPSIPTSHQQVIQCLYSSHNRSRPFKIREISPKSKFFIFAGPDV